MYLCIPQVLNEGQIAELVTCFNQQEFVDGKSTAGIAGATIKNNLQISPKSSQYGVMQAKVMEALMANTLFALAAMPLRIQPLRFARYGPGMFYGKHIDNAVMGKKAPARIDLAFTLFLSSPEAYGGGELVVYEPGTQRTFKLPAGSLVLYPGNSLHAVVEVTSGHRDVAVGWLQSLVRDPVKRRVIFELEDLRGKMLNQSGRTAEFDVVSRNVADLWRMWVEV